MDSEMLTQLLAGKHFNVPERIARGAWPHEPLPFQYVLKHLASVISNQRWFPSPWKDRAPGGMVDDRTSIERQSNDRYVVYFQRSGSSPMILAEEGKHVFSNPEDAADFYLRQELHLPGELDSWKVIE